MIFRIIKTDDINRQELEQCFAELSEQERQRILDKSGSDMQKSSLTGLFVVKTGLKDIFGIENPQILRQKNGKPYLKNNEMFFSIAHTADIVAVAFSECPVGIDIEYTRKYNDNVCRKMFSQSEQAYVKGDDIKFTKIWTLKEAAVKATGEGIGALRKYCFNICGDEISADFKNARIVQSVKNNLIISVLELYKPTVI